MSSIGGCGIDIEELARFKKILYNNDRFEIPQLIYDVFTTKEIKINKKYDPLIKFALGFSCKESVFKSFGISWINSEIYWKDIELIFKSDNLNSYIIKLNGYAIKLFEEKKYKKIISSFSYNEIYVVFKTIIVK